MTTPMITHKHVAEQPILFIRRRVSRADIAETLSYCLGTVAAYCMEHRLEISGPPFARYPSVDAGAVTIEAGLPLAAPSKGEGEIESGVLQAGPAAVAIHEGHYDRLRHTYQAIEEWAAKNGHRLAGPPWESYVTDPGEHPDPADWRTEVYWPIEG